MAEFFARPKMYLFQCILFAFKMQHIWNTEGAMRTINPLDFHCIFLMLFALLQGCASSGVAPEPIKIAEPRQTRPVMEPSELPRASVPIESAPAEAPFAGPIVIFPHHSTELPPSALSVINHVVEKLKSDSDANVLLIGRTEAMGSRELSIAIASRCTSAVKAALLKKGIRSNRIRTVSRGADSSRRGCLTDTCKTKARRVEVVLNAW